MIFASWGLSVEWHETPFFQFHFEFFAFTYILTGISGRILLSGPLKFLRGLKAILFSPKEEDREISEFYRKLANFTLVWGSLGFLTGVIISTIGIRHLDQIGYGLAFGIFSFFYASCIVFCLFWPIRFRYEPKYPLIGPELSGHFPVAESLLGFSGYALLRLLMSLVLIAMCNYQQYSEEYIRPDELSLAFLIAIIPISPTDFISEIGDYSKIGIYINLPSFLSILAGLGIFRLSAGRIRNRLDWIPVSILLGVIFSIYGFIIMFSNLDPSKYGSGVFVSFLSSLYGLIFAILFFIGNKRVATLFALGALILTLSQSLESAISQLKCDIMEIEPLDWIILCIVSTIFICLLLSFVYLLFGGINNLLRKKEDNPEPGLEEKERTAEKILESAINKKT